MHRNVGGLDRVLRVVIGLALLSLILWVPGPMRWWGLVGLLPLGSAVVRFCPLYTVLGINTCPRDRA
ncbi:MAG TPA: DUF2892 domain-containing protein [Paenirhodobacter sp.]